MRRATSLKAPIVRPCPVCGETTEHDVRYEKWGYPIRACRGCGLGATEVGSDFDPSAIYRREYFIGGKRDGYANYYASEAVLRDEFRRALAHLRQRGARSGRLLEIGCAGGFFLLEAAEHFECVGIDVAAEAIEFARSRGVDAFAGQPDAEFFRSQGPFDAVVMLDVIEHLDDPASVVERIHGALRDGGSLMISTGDWDSPLARLFGRRWRLMMPPQHLFFFSAATLTKMLDRIGFEVVDCPKPWKRVPLGLAAFQLAQRARLPLPRWSFLDRLGVPVNLFDAVRLIARKRGGGPE